MWLFTSGSFVSIVANRDDPKKLLVRGREEGHIERLFPKASVFQMDDADYRYRALVSRKVVAQVFAKQVADIGYDNFKQTVTESRYHTACLGVWSVMHELQSNPVR